MHEEESRTVMKRSRACDAYRIPENPRLLFNPVLVLIKLNHLFPDALPAPVITAGIFSYLLLFPLRPHNSADLDNVYDQVVQHIYKSRYKQNL